MAAQIGRERKEREPKVLNQNVAVFRSKRPVERFMIEERETRQGGTAKRPALDKDAVGGSVDCSASKPLAKPAIIAAPELVPPK